MDEKEAEARPLMGTIFLVYMYVYVYIFIVYDKGEVVYLLSVKTFGKLKGSVSPSSSSFLLTCIQKKYKE